MTKNKITSVLLKILLVITAFSVLMVIFVSAETATDGGSSIEDGDTVVSTSTDDNSAETTSAANITFPWIYADGMVFQRNKTINVFGYSDNIDAELKITLGDRVGTASVDETGEWYVELEPMEAAWNLTLTIEQTNCTEENVIQFADVAVGEVWVVAGQSNADQYVGYIEDSVELSLVANSLTNIRACKSQVCTAKTEQGLTPDRYGASARGTTWDTEVKKSDVTAVKTGTSFSATGYATVAKIAAELGPEVPVAMVQISYSASSIKAWVSYDSLKQLSPSEAEKFDDCVAAGITTGSPQHKMGSVIYNYMIAPLEGYEVAGVVWYQGCSDVEGATTPRRLGVEGSTYTDYFKAFQSDLRGAFGNDSELPFYVVQLAPYPDYAMGADDSAENIANLRAEQFALCRELDNTYLVSTAAEGGIWTKYQAKVDFIHPVRKSPIGSRCAYAILANEYGMKNADVYTHPDIVSVTALGSTVTVTFDSELRLLFGDTIIGFELSDDGNVWVSGTAQIDGKNAVITSSLTAPKYVRYGHSDMYAELADGSLVQVEDREYQSGEDGQTGDSITIISGDSSYLLDDTRDMVRSMHYGNLTNLSGIAMPVFQLEIE